MDPKSPTFKLLRYRDLVDRGIVSNRMTLHRWIVGNDFPKPIKIGPNSIAWRVDDVESWLAERARASKTPLSE